MTVTAKPAIAPPGAPIVTPTRMRTRTGGSSTPSTAVPALAPSDVPSVLPPPSATSSASTAHLPDATVPCAPTGETPQDATSLASGAFAPANGPGCGTAGNGTVASMNGTDPHVGPSAKATGDRSVKTVPASAAQPDAGVTKDASITKGASSVPLGKGASADAPVPGEVGKAPPIAVVKLEPVEGTGGAGRTAPVNGGDSAAMLPVAKMGTSAQGPACAGLPGSSSVPAGVMVDGRGVLGSDGSTMSTASGVIPAAASVGMVPTVTAAAAVPHEGSQNHEGIGLSVAPSGSTCSAPPAATLPPIPTSSSGPPLSPSLGPTHVAVKPGTTHETAQVAASLPSPNVALNAASHVPSMHEHTHLSLSAICSPSLMLPPGVLDGSLRVSLDGGPISPTTEALGAIALDHGHPHEDDPHHHHQHPHHDHGDQGAHDTLDTDPMHGHVLHSEHGVRAHSDHAVHSEPAHKGHVALARDPAQGSCLPSDPIQPGHDLDGDHVLHSDHGAMHSDHALGDGHGAEDHALAGGHLLTDDGFHHVGLSLDHVDLDITLGHIGLDLDVARDVGAHEGVGEVVAGDAGSGGAAVKEEFLPGCMELDGLPATVKQEEHPLDEGHLAVGLPADAHLATSSADPLHPSDPLHLPTPLHSSHVGTKPKMEPPANHPRALAAALPAPSQAIGQAQGPPRLHPGAPGQAQVIPGMRAPSAQMPAQRQALPQPSPGQLQQPQQQRPRPLLPTSAKPQGGAPGGSAVLGGEGAGVTLAHANADGGMASVMHEQAAGGAQDVANASTPAGSSNQNGTVMVGGLPSAQLSNGNGTMAGGSGGSSANGVPNGSRAPLLAPVEWTAEEQKILDDTLAALAAIGSPGAGGGGVAGGGVGGGGGGGGPVPAATLVERYLVVADKLENKSVRDVAYRCRWLSKQREANKRKKAGDDVNAQRKVVNKKVLHTPDGAPVGGAGGPMAMAPMGTLHQHEQFPANLLDQNAKVIAQIQLNLQNMKLQENIQQLLLCRDNILCIQNWLSSPVGSASPLPPLPVSIKMDSCNLLLAPMAATAPAPVTGAVPS